MFDQNTLPEFWLSVETEYAELVRLAIDILLPFVSTWLCEATFSTLTYIKSKNHTRLLTVDYNLQIALLGIKQIGMLCSQKQAQPSH